ncbi:MAG: hypothetical protein KGJ07_10380, partial [Patescibacteria group bacterium]|nr:hypothetical protein [Patescibacteria group bacterium]
MKNIFSVWILLVITVSCIFGVTYFVVQQDIRIGANDPQIQIAEDTANALSNHHYLNISQHTVDISQSLMSFRMTFDANGKVQSSEGVLHGKTPVVPFGVFSSVKNNGEGRFTWQPESGVRIAAVVVAYNNGYVLAGRNIREVEKREDNLLKQI